jgi:hypothetical protein
MGETTRRITLAAAALALALGAAACGKSSESKGGGATANTQDPNANAKSKSTGKAPLVGKWKFEGMEVYQTFNSKGRVRYQLPEGTSCVGTFEDKDGAVSITYDEGQSGCVDGAMPYKLEDGGKTLDFMGARYTRVDRDDDTSF